MKLTRPLQRVLLIFLDDPAAPRYGYDLMKAARLPSGTLYPMLARLQEEGMVSSHWERHEGGRPPRKYYQLTGEGVRMAGRELARVSRAGIPGLPRPAAGLT